MLVTSRRGDIQGQGRFNTGTAVKHQNNGTPARVDNFSRTFERMVAGGLGLFAASRRRDQLVRFVPTALPQIRAGSS